VRFSVELRVPFLRSVGQREDESAGVCPFLAKEGQKKHRSLYTPGGRCHLFDH